MNVLVVSTTFHPDLAVLQQQLAALATGSMRRVARAHGETRVAGLSPPRLMPGPRPAKCSGAD